MDMQEQLAAAQGELAELQEALHRSNAAEEDARRRAILLEREFARVQANAEEAMAAIQARRPMETIKWTRPKFEGPKDDVVLFIRKLRGYLRAMMVGEAASVSVAANCLEGPASDWWWSAGDEGQRCASIDEFEQLLTTRWQQADRESQARDARTRLKMTGTLEEYIQAYQDINSRINDEGEANRIHMFVEKLEPEVALHVRSQRPGTLDFAIRDARTYCHIRGAKPAKDMSSMEIDTVSTNLLESETNAFHAQDRAQRGHSQEQQLYRPRGRGRTQGRGRGRGREPGHEIRCYNCSGRGHIASVCPSVSS